MTLDLKVKYGTLYDDIIVVQHPLKWLKFVDFCEIIFIRQRGVRFRHSSPIFSLPKINRVNYNLMMGFNMPKMH